MRGSPTDDTYNDNVDHQPTLHVKGNLQCPSRKPIPRSRRAAEKLLANVST